MLGDEGMATGIAHGGGTNVDSADLKGLTGDAKSGYWGRRAGGRGGFLNRCRPPSLRFAHHPCLT